MANQYRKIDPEDSWIVTDRGNIIGVALDGVSVPSTLNKSSYAPAATTTASRNLTTADAGQLVMTNSGSAIALTILNDSTVSWEGNDRIEAYQGGAGALSWTAGSGVTIRGSAPTPAQYTTQRVMRVGANEWAYF